MVECVASLSLSGLPGLIINLSNDSAQLFSSSIDGLERRKRKLLDRRYDGEFLRFTQIDRFSRLTTFVGAYGQTEIE